MWILTGLALLVTVAPGGVFGVISFAFKPLKEQTWYQIVSVLLSGILTYGIAFGRLLRIGMLILYWTLRTEITTAELAAPIGLEIKRLIILSLIGIQGECQAIMEVCEYMRMLDMIPMGSSYPLPIILYFMAFLSMGIAYFATRPNKKRASD